MYLNDERHMGEEQLMTLIIGMDAGVFAAWLGTILAMLLCVLYGVYYHLRKKNEKQKQIKTKREKNQEEEE